MAEVLIASLLCACNARITTDTRPAYRTALLGTRPKQLNPIGSPGYAEFTLLNQLCGRLVSLNSSLGLDADIAERWEVDSTETVYDFFLNPSKHFVSGDIVRAEDVIYTLNRLSDKSQSQVHRWTEEIRTVEQISKTHVRITLNKPNPRFIYRLAHPRYCVVARKEPVLTVQDLQLPNSSGPYFVLPSPVTEIRLKASKDFEAKALESSITVAFLDQRQAVEAFNQGRLDDLAFYFLSDSELASLRNANVSSKRLHWTWMMIINPLRANFLRVEQRLSFLASLDIEKLRSDWGATDPWTGSVIPADLLPGGSTSAGPVNAAQAQAFVCSEGPFKVSIIGGIEREQRLADALRAQFKRLTTCQVRVEVVTMDEYERHWNAGSADVYIFGFDATVADPLAYYDHFIAGRTDSQIFASPSKVSAEYDRLYQKPLRARTSEDYQKIQSALAEEGFALPLGSPVYQLVYKQNVTHTVWNPLGMMYNRWYEVGR